MSAYIVEDKTINRIISYLSQDQHSTWTKKRLLDEAAINANDLDTLARRMLELNIVAVNARYGTEEAESFEDLDYKISHEPVERVQALKSLRCWLYQCSEGDADKTPLFLIMEEYSNRLADEVISKMPEYDKAEWG